MIERVDFPCKETRRRRRAARAASLLFAAALASLIASCGGTPKTAPEPVVATAPEPAAEPPKPSLADLIAADDQNGIKTFFASQDQLNTPDPQGSYPPSPRHREGLGQDGRGPPPPWRQERVEEQGGSEPPAPGDRQGRGRLREDPH